MKNGKGLFSFGDGSTYEGELKNDEIDGLGIYKWTDGKVYDGYWKRGQMHTELGQLSTFTWSDGRKYVGEYKDDKKEGKGLFTFANGVVYDGDWLNGKQHGKGILISYEDNNNMKIEKNRMEGVWENGKRLQD